MAALNYHILALSVESNSSRISTRFKREILPGLIGPKTARSREFPSNGRLGLRTAVCLPANKKVTKFWLGSLLPTTRPERICGIVNRFTNLVCQLTLSRRNAYNLSDVEISENGPVYCDHCDRHGMLFILSSDQFPGSKLAVGFSNGTAGAELSRGRHSASEAKHKTVAPEVSNNSLPCVYRPKVAQNFASTCCASVFSISFLWSRPSFGLYTLILNAPEPFFTTSPVVGPKPR